MVVNDNKSSKKIEPHLFFPDIILESPFPQNSLRGENCIIYKQAFLKRLIDQLELFTRKTF